MVVFQFVSVYFFQCLVHCCTIAVAVAVAVVAAAAAATAGGGGTLAVDDSRCFGRVVPFWVAHGQYVFLCSFLFLFACPFNIFHLFLKWFTHDAFAIDGDQHVTDVDQTRIGCRSMLSIFQPFECFDRGFFTTPVGLPHNAGSKGMAR